MALRDKERYYWLKLPRNFFKRHDITVIEDMPNGKDYVLFYLKLMLESVDHEGALRFSDVIPYNEQMLASVTRTNVDIVRSALRLFEQLGMIEVYDDKTLFMKETAKLLGSETFAAKRQRELREKNRAGDNVALPSPDCRQEIEKEIDTEIEKDTEEDVVEARAETDLGQIMSYYMENISMGAPSGVVTATIQSYAEELAPDVVLHAIQQAAERDVHNWTYIKAILDRYKTSGLTTLEAVEMDERRTRSARDGGKFVHGLSGSTEDKINGTTGRFDFIRADNE